MTTNIAWIANRPIAHRGLHDYSRPENSLAAIEAAIEADYAVEIDVRTTLDLKAAVFHDASLDRLCGMSLQVSSVSSANLRNLTLFDTQEKIPMLEDVLALVNGRVPIFVEIKNPAQPGMLEEEVCRQLVSYRGPFAIQSFNPLTLGWFRTNYFSAPRGQISYSYKDDFRPWWKTILLRNYVWNCISKPHFLSHDWRDLPSFASSLIRKKYRLPILAWTVRSKEEAAAASQHADAIIFENFRP
jgi:glycerophosphoryl diester phosphodiesterase